MSRGISDCKICSKTFTHRIRPGRGLYCSRSCGNRAISQRRSQQSILRKTRANCKTCNKEILYSPCDQPGIYCSRTCQATARTFSPDQHKKSLKIRFEKYITKNNNCWKWNGQTNKGGYGYLGYSSSDILAHRASWIIYFGEIPEGLNVLHKCDNPPCTNPEHLFLGTHNDNVQDMIKKGRANHGFKKGMIPHNKKTYRNQLCLF